MFEVNEASPVPGGSQILKTASSASQAEEERCGLEVVQGQGGKWGAAQSFSYRRAAQLHYSNCPFTKVTKFISHLYYYILSIFIQITSLF